MKRKTSLNDLFESKAKVIYLNSFHLADLRWNTEESCKGQIEYEPFFIKKGESYPRVPVILKSDSLPWDIGNAYLVSLLTQPSLSNLKTISSKAICLKYYLQYLEDTAVSTIKCNRMIEVMNFISHSFSRRFPTKRLSRSFIK